MNTSAIKTKILMVDDKPANLLALERLLKDLPVELYKATSGNDALILTLHHDFALALLDIQMPEMDGYELAELLRQEEKTARMPFIFISAIYTDHINIFKGYEKGAFSYICKPFEPEILLNKVKLFVDMYQQEQVLRLRTEELMHINRELEAFTYAVSHDLRAPLRAIDGFSQMLEEDCGQALDAPCRDYLARIFRAVQRMDALISDLLSLSRVTRADINIGAVDLAALASDIVEELRERMPDREVEVVIQQPLPASGDARLLRIVLENLLNNAWKFTTGTDSPRVEIGQLDKDAAVYYVRDNGVGFDMAYADKLFNAFQRLHSDKRFPGNGIGLATVQRVIHKHGGQIWGEGKPGHGAVFYFTLRQ
jgi:signal transduction histidine kinase